MQSFKNQIKTFFNFNKRQERGAFVLIVLIIIAFVIDLFLPVLFQEEVYDYSSTLKEIEEWKASAIEIVDEKPSPHKTTRIKESPVKKIKLNPIPFNPNNLPEEKWLEMGMPDKVVKTILKYEAKGGSFKKKEDLQKIYGLTPKIYLQLKDYILIPSPEFPKEKHRDSIFSKSDKIKTFIRLDINRADSVAFLEVPGIGPFYAGQIVKYRNRLGGYVSIKQLTELYKIDSIRLNTWLPYLTFKDTLIIPIDINTADFKTVLKHPYIDYETTKKIFNLRNKLGRYAGIYQLKKDSILSDSLFQKLKPYLKVN
ncbi:MAG: helix-hairpin-helix domain-containing protein [Bacteroidales bacterium]|nr:helix-hairpin-helix domain-containing protein [Bacteroidales bacterium]